MAEIGDIIACRGDKYLVIAYIKPPVESGVVLDAVNEALSFEDYAKRLGKVRGYYCVSLNDNNTIYYIQNNFDILLTGNDVQSEQDNNSIFYMQGNFDIKVEKKNVISKNKLKVYYTKLRLVGKLPKYALFEDAYKEQLKEDWKKVLIHQEELMLQLCVRQVYDKDGFYLLINKDAKYLLAKVGNKFYTLSKVSNYAFYRKEQNFQLHELPRDAITENDGRKIIPMFDLRKRYPDIKERKNVRKENLYSIGNVYGKIVDF